EPFRLGWDGWAELFTSPITISSIGYSFLLAIRVPIGLVIAFGIAWSLVRLDIPGRRFIVYALWFTYFLPAVPMTMGWILLLDENYGIINQLLQRLSLASGPVFSIYSIGGILWVHLTLSTIPVMVILLEPAIRQLDVRNEEAALMCGVSRLRTLLRVTFPLIAPTVALTLIAGLAKSLELFEIERLLGVPARVYVFATRIYDLL